MVPKWNLEYLDIQTFYCGDLCVITFFFTTLIFIARKVPIGKVRIVLIWRSLTEGLAVCRKLPEYCYRVKQKNLGESLN